jgi:hypothetical protein
MVKKFAHSNNVTMFTGRSLFSICSKNKKMKIKHSDILVVEDGSKWKQIALDA